MPRSSVAGNKPVNQRNQSKGCPEGQAHKEIAGQKLLYGLKNGVLH
jgi:hypothetical protein